MELAAALLMIVLSFDWIDSLQLNVVRSTSEDKLTSLLLKSRNKREADIAFGKVKGVISLFNDITARCTYLGPVIELNHSLGYIFKHSNKS